MLKFPDGDHSLLQLRAQSTQHRFPLGVNFVREYKNHVSLDFIGGKDQA
jgi:hypothetical protein